MTPLGALLVAVLVVLLARWRRFPWALAVGGLTPAGVAVVAGGVPVPTFYAATVAVVAVTTLASAATGRGGYERLEAAPPPRGVVLLWVFFGWALLVTLVAPALFPGTAVTQNGTTRVLLPGEISKSNIAQVVYLALSVLVVTSLARWGPARPTVLGLVCAGATLLSGWRLLSQSVGTPFPEGFFDNSPTLAFIETAPGGAERFRGIFSEPSALGALMLGTIAYGAVQLISAEGRSRWGWVGLMALAAWMGYYSTSGTFAIGIAVLAALGLLAAVGRALTVGRLRSRASLVVLPLAAVALAVTSSRWVTWLAETVRAKIGSSSYTDRSGADSAAYQLVWRTWGLGVGLGSHRPSSFLAGLLVATGLVGGVLFALAVGMIALRARARPEVRAALWVLLSQLVAKAVAGPDLTDPSGLLWLSLGILAASERGTPASVSTLEGLVTESALVRT